MSWAGDFWTRRKAQVEAEAQAQARTAEAETREADHADKTDAEICADLGLPDPDTMQTGDDFSAFMGRAVPERLRRRALRRLWRSNPVLANVDGLVDYGQDFTDSATVIENLQTAYQVGKGMVAHVEALARQADADADADTQGSDDGALAAQDASDAAEDSAPEPSAPDRAGPYVWQAAADADPGEAPPPRRRMRFAFDETASRDKAEASA